MEEKKTSKKIGVNTSSGAKKVERIEKQTVSASTKKKPVGNSVKQTAKATAKRTITKKVEAENDKADARIQQAKARAERKAYRKAVREEKMQHFKEKRLQAKERAMEKRIQAKERAQERRAARAARKDMLRNETAVQRMERKEREKQERVALRKQNAELRHELELKKKEERMHKRQLAAANRKHKREEGTKRRSNRTPGIGGWLAAVISLGVASLAMLTVITVGGVNLNNMSVMMGSGYRSNLYEMTELSEGLNSNLNKLRVANGVLEQRKLLTEILVQSELMESALERFPVDMATTNNVTSFVNRTSDYARKGLNEVSSGRSLSEKDAETLEYMYQTNAAILKELQVLRNTMTEKDWMKLVRNAKNGIMNDGLTQLNAGVSVQDGPLTENKVKTAAKGLAKEKEITSAQAEDMAKEYFADYGIDKAEYTGDVVTEGLSCFNITLTDARGREIYAQISKSGGKLIMFDCHEDCQANNFSQEECLQIAQEFLKKLGIQNMKAVWLQENGATANIKFAYEQNGVICYPDLIVVKVCETKGVPVGMQAREYYLNHAERTIPTAEISQKAAIKSLGKFQPATARLALIPQNGEEILTYEFTGEYQGEEYFAYVDAKSGEEIEMFAVTNTKQGRILR